ncbi:NAD(P)-binding protein [Delitschia confertaspora ATCC 74209]|uniref:NAD(P)-binding protein n=1 Tax=Delitschia confertaspora ATCC 74209 TaxID=1513339 RepID=A0A9P4MP10_9PLEO|nr:NAD(P)-binding protein [Delitschia confertaspora ATCC 74209]
MVNVLLTAFSNATIPLNRLLAWADFAVHYVSGYFLYFLVGGYEPQFHTRPALGKGYSPSVLVTGASQGIGLATSLYLASKGYTVFASVKDEQELQLIKHEIKSRDLPSNVSIRPLIMDVLSSSSIASAVSEVSSAVHGNSKTPFVGVINNAGFCMISPMELTPDKAVRDLFELDFWAYISVVKAFLPIIKEYQGRFINVGSYGGFVNPPMWVPYSAAKAAIEGMTRSWRFELKPFGVGMTSVRPGWTRYVSHYPNPRHHNRLSRNALSFYFLSFFLTLTCRTHGIGPKITRAWDGYWNHVKEGYVPAGVDSLGHVVDTDKSCGEREKQVYGPMMSKWQGLVLAAADGAAQTAEAVATTVYDAMTDPFLQPYYTVGYDALIGQTVRDLVPESIYEVGMARLFESKITERVLSPYTPS